jgi:hypothetical protein
MVLVEQWSQALLVLLEQVVAVLQAEQVRVAVSFQCPSLLDKDQEDSVLADEQESITIKALCVEESE